MKLERDARNTCAEQEVVAQIRQQGHLFPTERMLALVVAGEPQDEPDGESGVMTCTLHPCRHCRRLLREIPEMRPDTIIITVKLEVDFWEIHSFQEILELHGIAT
ncbi:MAG: hypothetical protein IPK84_03540 [Candidatus Moraniibacteriota bacterium]|nr:MAG: hypothetical protein IPK84_03540 [Candidatus Moranbacteria bacterium]